MLHRAKKRNPDAVVVAAGCYVQTGQDAVAEDTAVDLVIGNNRKKDIAVILEEYLEKKEQGILSQPAATTTASGFLFLARCSICLLFWSAILVTVHVLTI